MMHAREDVHTDAHRLEWAALGGLYLFTLIAAVGYGWFGLDPSRLPSTPIALRIYTLSFELFAQAHIVLAATILLVPLLRRNGAAVIVPLSSVYAIAFASEHIGTGYGIPFGGYGYTGLLGARLGPRVPLLIPLSWFLMAFPAWILAKNAFPAAAHRRARVLFGALWLVAWDLALDPAMSYLTPYWRWEEAGPYYGMPWLNLVGWYLTGLALLFVLDLLSERTRLSSFPLRWACAYYFGILLMPLGMLAAAGAWLAVLVTSAAVTVLTAVLLLRRAQLGGAVPALPSANPVEA